MWIAELVLVVVAWARGWKGWALIPVAIPIVLAMWLVVMGGIYNSSQGAIQRTAEKLTIVDTFACMVLLVMVIISPSSTEEHP